MATGVQANVRGKFMMPSLPFWAPSFPLNLWFTGSIHEIDSSITQLQHHLSMSSRSDPRHPIIFFKMALQHFRRSAVSLSNRTEDLDNSIRYFTKSILLPPFSWLQHGLRILEALFFLADALFIRAEESKQPEHAIYATKYFLHLRDQPHEIPNISRHVVTASLVKALALQVELEVGNVIQNIREIAVLSRELVSLETSGVDVPHLIFLICVIVVSRVRPNVPDLPLDEIIESLRAARKHRPDVLEGRIALALSLACRYHVTRMDDDYEEAMPILDEIIASSPGESRFISTARRCATGLVATLAMQRSDAYPTPEHLEEAIYRTRTSFTSPSVKGVGPWDPEVIAMERVRYFGSIEGVGGSPGGLLNALFSQAQAEPKVHEFILTFGKMKSLLFEISNSDDTAKLDQFIEQGRFILASSPIPAFLDLFSVILFEAFMRTKKIEYLNGTISVRRQLIETALSQAARAMAITPLFQSLIARSEHFPGYCTQDLDEELDVLSQFVGTSAILPDRFWFACEWAHFARRYQHSTVSLAYETAMSLAQDALLLSPTLQLQHTTLATHAITQSLPLDYASYRVDQHQLAEALEVLERGRALLWSEMRHLRISADQLLEVDPELGRKFAAVNRELEELTKSVPPSHKLGMPANDGASDDLKAADPFGRLVLKRRGLLMERDKLISQIQALPRFDSFLASPSFDTLRSAASSGPVIIINHSQWRSDILILLSNVPPSLISTPHDFYHSASALKGKLLDSRRKSGLDSKDHDETLALVLAELYRFVGKPVIDRLRQLQVPEQSRIWWCPTSVFCSLPLHAMGPIPSDDNDDPRYFLDLYICSYTSSLSALIQSRHRDSVSRSSDRPSVLLVAQLDPSLPTVGGEIQVVQALDTEVTSLISEAATPATVMESFHHYQFVHFASHGTLEAGKPFEAGFELYGDERLTLLEIVRAHLPNAEFAFLSACHTAEVTEGSVVDEGLHLAAAVQYCGFRSVVGTMWDMVDEDGQVLAKHFYKALFSGQRGTPYHERSAKALRFAVKKLRSKRKITLERWVNFVHYGA